MTIPVSASQPGRRAYEDSVRLDTGGIVTGLREILGAQLVAYLGRVSNTRSVREWAEGSRAPGADVVQRLRTAYYVAGILIERESSKTIQAWFQGMNPELGDQSPAALLRIERRNRADGHFGRSLFCRPRIAGRLEHEFLQKPTAARPGPSSHRAVAVTRQVGHGSCEVSLPDGYPEFLGALKRRVRDAQGRAHRTVNTQLIELYWSLGRAILTEQEEQGCVPESSIVSRGICSWSSLT